MIDLFAIVDVEGKLFGGWVVDHSGERTVPKWTAFSPRMLYMKEEAVRTAEKLRKRGLSVKVYSVKLVEVEG